MRNAVRSGRSGSGIPSFPPPGGRFSFHPVRTNADFLQELHRRGATRLRRVTFRRNRRTLWSLTRSGTALNLHQAYRDAPEPLLAAFALLVREGGVGSTAARRAARLVREWPPLTSAILKARQEHDRRRRARGRSPHCCGTPEQRRYLRSLYRYFNRTRFGGALPDDTPLRLSRRMKSALGHMRPASAPDGGRYVAEIALNVDLLLEGNGAERADTLLHEMAHAADYLETGHRGHGPSWRAWARRVGCRPTTLYHRPVRFRSRRSAPVTRTPPLPRPLRT